MPGSSYANQGYDYIEVSGFAEYVTYQDPVTGDSSGSNPYGAATFRGATVDAPKGIRPELYFRYMKSKFSYLQNKKISERAEKLTRAFDKAVKNGQDFLAKKFLAEVVGEYRETLILAKGFKRFIEKEQLDKHKRNIRGGHISDTRFEKFTRVIPKDVLAAKEKSHGLFDGYVIYHYWNEEAEKKREKKQKLSGEERSGMRDPVLFGWIAETNRLYFVAEWEDEFCDLSFDEIVDHLGMDKSETTIPKDPTLK